MRNGVVGYRDLEVWQLSMTLVEKVFKLTEQLPGDQRFALVSQMQRAAISIPSNIAEGHAKRSGKDYKRHVTIAAGSVAELETQIELCVRLSFCSRDDVRTSWTLAQRVAQMLSRLATSLNNKPESRTPKAERRP
jgi:four helix bundle protein